MHHYQDLIELFNQSLGKQYQTQLVKGDDEPIYLPADKTCAYHRIVFAHGFYASALHEISHWCIAGSARRKLEDFGYWYCPDGRNAEQQKAFEQVEIKPQAIEWAFNVAAGREFNVSVDNLNGAEPNRQAFEANIYQQVKYYLQHGFPKDAQAFIQILCDFYHTSYPLKLTDFKPKYQPQELCIHV